MTTKHQLDLSAEQLTRFHEDGFLMVPNLFPESMVNLLLEVAHHDRRITEATGPNDQTGALSRIFLRCDLEDDIYSAFARSPRIIDPLEQIFEDEVYQIHHKMMLKEPRVGGAWEWHQDYGYWYNDRFLFPTMASCMVAVDRASKENGCLQVLVGSHRMGRLDHMEVGGQTGADPERVAAAAQRLEIFYCEMEPGTGLFFHCNTLHRSDQNRSPMSRWSLICCYNTMGNQSYDGASQAAPVAIDRRSDEQITRIGRAQLDNTDTE